MRDSFVKTLFEFAQADRTVKIVTGDLGFGVLKPFYESLPECFINAGIAEQNMTSFAAGMALEGLRPVTYSIGNFPTLRCLEQIRNDVCYPDANVKIVCVGSGYAYGVLGVSHHATEDIGVLCSLPNLIVLSPCDRREAIACTRFMMNNSHPCYLRLGRNGSRDFTVDQVSVSINCVLSGNDYCIFATGEIIGEALKAANELKKFADISVAVYSCPLLKPFPKDIFFEIVRTQSFKALFTLEEHTTTNGLGAIVSECFDESSRKPPIYRIGINDRYLSEVGDQMYLRSLAGIDADSIVELIERIDHSLRR